MQTIEIHRDKLLPIIKENQKKHDDIYNAAVSGYWEKAEQVLQEKLAKVQAKQKIENYLGLAYPDNHADDYLRAISMIELSHQDVIDLSQQEFDQYVRNQWNWRSSFLTINSAYISGCAGPAGAIGINGSGLTF